MLCNAGVLLVSAELHTRNTILAKDEILVYIDGVAAIEPMLDGECHYFERAARAIKLQRRPRLQVRATS